MYLCANACVFECAFKSIKIIAGRCIHSIPWYAIPFSLGYWCGGASSFAESFENRLGHLIFYTICFHTPAASCNSFHSVVAHVNSIFLIPPALHRHTSAHQRYVAWSQHYAEMMTLLALLALLALIVMPCGAPSKNSNHSNVNDNHKIDQPTLAGEPDFHFWSKHARSHTINMHSSYAYTL